MMDLQQETLFTMNSLSLKYRTLYYYTNQDVGFNRANVEKALEQAGMTVQDYIRKSKGIMVVIITITA